MEPSVCKITILCKIDIDVRIILKRMFRMAKKWDGKVRNSLIWLKMGISGGLLLRR
jgi:hypothetical protein